MKKFKLENIILTFLIFAIGYILIFNILFYSPIYGYDAEAHYSYVDYLSRYLPYRLKLPSIENSREFFSPPIAYIFPSVVQVICRNLIDSSNYLLDCKPIYGKVTQIFQSILYVTTIFINLKTLKLINNSKKLIDIGYLLLVSLLAVNYRTISMIRGEPYILFFLSIFLYTIFKLEIEDFKPKKNFFIFQGCIIAALALSRQWAFLLLLPVVPLVFYKKFRTITNIYFWIKSSLIGIVLSSWFYIKLYLNYGSLTAFNMQPSYSIFEKVNFNFFVPNFEQLNYLFYKPIRPYLNNQFFTILYSDLWGDYWGYFVFTSNYLTLGRNQFLIGDYLANVQRISLITTFIIILFLFRTRRLKKDSFIIKYLNFSMFFTLLGYLVFVLYFPTNSGDTIKSTYIVQLFNLAVFSASIYFYKLKHTNKTIYNVIIILLISIFIFNFQSYLSHFPLSI